MKFPLEISSISQIGDFYKKKNFFEAIVLFSVDNLGWASVKGLHQYSKICQ